MKKDFDCVEMKRAIQAEIYEEIKDLTDEQRTEYFRSHALTGSLAEFWKTIKTVDEARAEDVRKERRA